MYDYALHAIYAAAAAPDTWPAALDAIATCYDSAGTVLILSRAQGHWSSIVSPGLASAAKDYDDWGWKLDFCMVRAREQAITEPDAFFTDRRLATLEEIGTHPYFTRFRALHGLGPFLSGQLLSDVGVFAALSLQGRANRAPFTEVEVESFTCIARHVERALMLTVKLLEAEVLSNTFAEALSKLSCGVLLLDANRDPVFANKAAQRMLGALLPLKAADSAMKSPQRKLVEEAVAAAASSTGMSKPPVPVLLPASARGRVIALYVMPFGQAVPSVLRESFIAAKVLLLAIEHDPAQPPDPLLVRNLLGLSQGEARLAALIGAGKSPREAAEQMGITEESARTVLKRVFLKTNTCKQSELAALLSRLIIREAP